MTSPVRPVDLDAAPAQPVRAVLALGANLGDRAATLRSAVGALQRTDGVRVESCSGVYETDPVGGPEQPAYLNAVVLVCTTLGPRALLRACQRVEADHGRVRLQHWGPRTLDVDVLAYADLVSSDAELTLPHPRAYERAFVLVPWASVDPDAVLPGRGGGPVVHLVAVAAGSGGVRPRPDVVLTAGPTAEPAP
jgi:2-amino-4-hydroxy-6-hydroxymethyldihydropteridine diphosphokinase